MTIGSVCPVLRIFDNQLAKKFYIDWLAFHLDWEHRPEDGGPSIMEVSRGDATLQLSEHYGDGSPATKLFIEVDDVEALSRELHERPNAYMKPGVEATDWGTRILAVLDPFGNRLVFSQAVALSGNQG
jgi:uncharacterized glyoxalase superfamily protein PhnB